MYNDEIYKSLNIDKKIIDLVKVEEDELKDTFKLYDDILEYNQIKVLKSFFKNKLSESDFNESTGYGYNDLGRDKIEKIYADIFNAEDALVRQQIVSGTHAIATVLYAMTKPGDNILSISGMPYDTILNTIGFNNETLSLKYYNISFDYVDLKDGTFDYEKIKEKINDKTKLITIQKSRGYSLRKSLSNEEVKKVIEFIKSFNKDIKIFVDNCYCEFVEKIEPTDVGADIIAGSLIKNLGAGIVKSGGYIVGKKDLIEKCALRLTAVGLGKEVGVSFNQNRNVITGLYFAPQVITNALKGVELFKKVLNDLNIITFPRFKEAQNDIVLAIKLGDEKRLENFCKNIQKSSAVDSFVSPEFSPMPGYDSKIIMASGSFISGSSIELSCDGPLREPYIAFMQGGLSYFQVKLALMNCLKDLI